MTLLIGTVGAALLLIAFTLEKFELLQNNSFEYNMLNFIGAALLTWYALILNSVPFIVLEGIWALIAFWYLVRRLAIRPK